MDLFDHQTYIVETLSFDDFDTTRVVDDDEFLTAVDIQIAYFNDNYMELMIAAQHDELSMEATS